MMNEIRDFDLEFTIVRKLEKPLDLDGIRIGKSKEFSF